MVNLKEKKMICNSETLKDLVTLVDMYQKYVYIGGEYGYRHDKYKEKKMIYINKINRLSQSYYNDIIRCNIPKFNRVVSFLYDNFDINMAIYADIICDLNAKITMLRKNYNKFEEIIESLYDSAVNIAPKNYKKKRNLRLFIHYMYYNGHIGRER
jgi:hypothetical protein